MNVVEIFKSIDGEGIRTGAPTIFIRFAGCNLRCEYCDTSYAMNGYQRDVKYSTLEAIVDEVVKYSVPNTPTHDGVSINVNNITITGGEPLLHVKDIISILEALNNTAFAYSVNIETNGSIDPAEFINLYNQTAFCMCRYNNLFFTFDIKTDSAGEYEKDVCIDLNTKKPKAFNNIDCISNYSVTHNVMKAVVGSESELEYVRSVYNQLTREEQLKFVWFISPVFGKIEPSTIVDFILKYPELNDWRVQVQLHKIIWDPNKRGV